MSTKQLALALAGILGSLSLAACDLDVPDLNNPLLDDLETHPTKALVTAACTGLLIGNRRNLAAENGLVDQLGILGREALNTDNADPRYTSEMLQGTLSRSSPFGGNFWALPYANIRLGNVILGSVDKVAELSSAERAAIRGFAHTIAALDLLEVIVTHDTNGGVIDTNHPLGEPLGAIVDKDAVYAEIARLLDAALSELDAGDAAFPFALSGGFHNDISALTFDTPATFRKFNRAIRARVAAYVKDYPGVLAALGMSFLDDLSPNIDFNRGVYHVYTTKTGDVTNGLINSNIFVDPPLQMEAESNGATIDARFTRKVGLDKDNKLVFNKLYPAPDSPAAIIRNEELILLKAEALFFSQPANVTAAFVALNLVRTKSGGLAPLAETSDPTTFVDELLYERRYSLLFEGGHRWIDLRRFGRMLPLDQPDDKRNVRYPIPLAECDARPNEPRCMLGST